MNTISDAKKTASKKEETVDSTLYDITINALDGTPIDFSSFKGKHLLFVNVASQCGFTNQYKDLQKLSDTYPDTLVVIGSPCNQFGKQEPGDATQIQTFCERNFGVTFLLTEKIDVKGSQQHPLYTWLTSKDLNGKKSSSVKWNFQKYLVNKDGKLMDYYFSITKPMSSKITASL
ncbi:MAG: glutathione peroxidase [Dokdonia sp.]|jgi:glutathione peroxidase